MAEGEGSLVQSSHDAFKDLGLQDELCEACQKLGWQYPTEIQKEAIPMALEGRDVLGLAETGSGKTAAFGLPLLQSLIRTPQRLFGLIVTPTRELAFQIKEQLEALGEVIGVTVCVVVGGVDMARQALQLAKKPHILVGTPGRIVDHLEKTLGFSLKSIKYLVLDEADRILDMDFELEVDKILHSIPSERQNMLFSATMTTKVRKLQRAALTDPVRVEVSSKYHTVGKLKQYMLFIPLKYKCLYLVHILHSIGSHSVIVFCATQIKTLKITLILRKLGFSAIPLYGKMDQSSRLSALTKFKAKQKSILLATDVAARGLDIPDVDFVINFDVPFQSKDYIHRVGRTARAGKSGVSITLVSQYEIEVYQRIEHVLKIKLPVYPTVEEEVMALQERITEAEYEAKFDMSNINTKMDAKKKRRKLNPTHSRIIKKKIF